jgi:hypothetical protein
VVETEQDYGRPTRMLFLGEDRLADGFRLIGFETHPNPTPSSSIGPSGSCCAVARRPSWSSTMPSCAGHPEPQARASRGGRIVVIAVPPLGEHPQLGSDVARRLAALFGNAVVNAKAEP